MNLGYWILFVHVNQLGLLEDWDLATNSHHTLQRHTNSCPLRFHSILRSSTLHIGNPSGSQSPDRRSSENRTTQLLGTSRRPSQSIFQRVG